MTIVNQLRGVMGILLIFAITSAASFSYELTTMRKDGRIVNYSGIVRGATQRLVKLEYAGTESDELIAEIDRTINGLIYGDPALGLPEVDEPYYHASMKEVDRSWKNLKEAIYKVRENPDLLDNLLDESEKFFGLTNEAVLLAENVSADKVSSAITIQVTAFLLNIIILISIWFMSRKKIGRPLTQLKHKVDGIVNRNFQHDEEDTLEMPEQGNDEIGILVRSIKTMHERLAGSRENMHDLAVSLEEQLMEVRDREEKIRLASQEQGVINSLLKTGLEDISLEEQLDRALEEVLSVSWLSLKPCGAIFLVEDKPDLLVLKAQKNLHHKLQSLCRYIRFGRCLCGRAAQSGKVEFSSSLDGKHDVRYKGIDEHGHYCVPILSGEIILGVMTFYLAHGHKRDEREENFLKTVANTLSGIILRRRAEEELRRNETSLAEAQRIAHIGDWRWDIEQNKLYWSDEVYHIFGLEKNEFGATYNEFLGAVHPDDRVIVEGAVNEALDGKRLYNIDHRIILPDHTERIVHEQAEVTFDEKGQPVNMIGTVQDITERIQTEDKLQMLYRAIEQSSSSIAITDTEGTIEYINPKFTELTGYTEEELIGKSSRILKSGMQDEEFYRELWSAITDRGEWQGEFHNRKKDGTLYWEFASITAVRDSNGVIKHYIKIVEDITRLKQVEKEKAELLLQLVQSQKMESLGTLSAGIAHEINTPVQFVGDNSHFLQNSFSDIVEFIRIARDLRESVGCNGSAPKLAEEMSKFEEKADIQYLLEETPIAIEQILDGVDRVRTIVKSMKSFSHPDKKEMESADLNKALEDTLVISRNEYKYVADIKTELDPDLPLIQCHLHELNQVFLNIIVNAAHAIKDASDVSESRGLITVTTKPDGEEVVISISDTGTGIPKEVAHRIFEPFFTTKEVGKGTGQGLAIAHSVVTQKHGGSLRVETELGKGTAFIIRLPIENKETSSRDIESNTGETDQKDRADNSMICSSD